jgi:hypothetical protein
MRKMLGVVTVCALVCAGSAFAAAFTLHGNAKGMRLAERVMNAFGKIPGYTYTQTKFFQVKTQGGKKPSLKYAFGFGTLQSGWSWASEKGAMGLVDNHVAWWRDDLTPTSKHAQPVEIVFKGGSGYWKFLNGHSTCFWTLNSSSSMPNDHGFVITGKVSAPKGNTLSYSYRWGNGQGEAHETDVIASSSHLVTSGHVSIGSYGFSFANRFGNVPVAPGVKVCK